MYLFDFLIAEKESCTNEKSCLPDDHIMEDVVDNFNFDVTGNLTEV